MKNLPRTCKVVVLAAVGVSAILSFQACVTQPFNQTFGLLINKTFHLVDVAGFIAALDKLSESADYHFHVVYDDGTSKDFRSGSTRKIKTDRVTMFEVPENISSREFTAIGSHVTQRVRSNKVQDIQIVLDELKKEEP